MTVAACSPGTVDGAVRTQSSSELGIEVSRVVAPDPTAPPPTSAGPSAGASASSSPTVMPAPPAPAPLDTYVTPGERLGIAGCRLFPRDNAFHASIARLPVHPRSERMIAAGGGSSMVLNAGFSAGIWDGARPGYPVNVADSRTTERVSVLGGVWRSTSDLYGHPIPDAPRFEGWPAKRWDRHLLVVDAATCRSHEMLGVTSPGENPIGQWLVDKAVTLDLETNEYRARGTVKVAGVSMLAGLVRFDEVATGNIDHAIAMSMPTAGSGDPVWPARYTDGPNDDPDAPPMGSWFRLREDVDLSGLGPQARVVAQALRDHGAVLVDTGGRFSLSGEPDLRWDDADLRGLRRFSLESFEVVDPTPMMVRRDSLQIR